MLLFKILIGICLGLSIICIAVTVVSGWETYQLSQMEWSDEAIEASCKNSGELSNTYTLSSCLADSEESYIFEGLVHIFKSLVHIVLFISTIGSLIFLTLSFYLIRKLRLREQP